MVGFITVRVKADISIPNILLDDQVILFLAIQDDHLMKECVTIYMTCMAEKLHNLT